jgi:hypothetical protein
LVVVEEVETMQLVVVALAVIEKLLAQVLGAILFLLKQVLQL